MSSATSSGSGHGCAGAACGAGEAMDVGLADGLVVTAGTVVPVVALTEVVVEAPLAQTAMTAIFDDWSALPPRPLRSAN